MYCVKVVSLFGPMGNVKKFNYYLHSTYLSIKIPKVWLGFESTPIVDQVSALGFKEKCMFIRICCSMPCHIFRNGSHLVLSKSDSSTFS